MGELVYGFHPVRERLRRRPQTVDEVLVSASRGGPRRGEIEELCRRHRIACSPVAESELRALARAKEHNGFLARLHDAAEAAEVAPADPDLQVLLEDVQDPRNLGALLRVCEGAGVGRVLIRDRGSAPLTATVAKTSAGASEWLAIERITNSAQEIARCEKEGYWVYGAAMEGDPPWNVDLTGRVMICFGGEEKGLRERTRKLCDGLIGLPMRGRVGSLNVAAAAAAILYEAVRQRRAKGDGPLATASASE